MTARDRTVLGVVVGVVIIVAAWLLVVAPKRSTASQLSTQISSVQSQLDQARTTVAQGEAARAAFTGSYTVLARLGEAVPTDDDVPSLIYEIQDAATRSHVQFNSLALSSSGAAATTTPTTTTTPTSSSSTAGAAAAAAASLPPGVSVGPGGFPLEPFSFTFTGNFFHLSSFFGRLQRFVVIGAKSIGVSGRLLTLNSISLAVAPGGFPNITATVLADTYLLPASQGLTAGATPLGPGSQASSTTSTTVTPPAVVTTP